MINKIMMWNKHHALFRKYSISIIILYIHYYMIICMLYILFRKRNQDQNVGVISPEIKLRWHRYIMNFLLQTILFSALKDSENDLDNLFSAISKSWTDRQNVAKTFLLHICYRRCLKQKLSHWRLRKLKELSEIIFFPKSSSSCSTPCSPHVHHACALFKILQDI